MGRLKNNNSGFSLIELIIAMAMLAIIMTAIGTIMGSSVMGQRQSKADIRVHTAAQETYTQVSDTVMQATDIVIVGYASDSEYTFDDCGSSVGESYTLTYFVKDETMKQFIINNPDVYGTSGANSSNVVLFKDLGTASVGKYIYPQKLVVRTSAPIDMSYVPGYNPSNAEQSLTDNIFGGTVLVQKYSATYVDESGFGQNVTMYKTYDNIIHTFTFDKETMYYEKKHSFMTGLDDIMNPAQPEFNVYNEGLSYVLSSSDTIPLSGCMITVDVDAGALGIDFKFSDLDKTYNTDGMVNIRNSYVLKARKE